MIRPLGLTAELRAGGITGERIVCVPDGPTESVEMLIVEDQGVMRALLRDFLQSNYPAALITEAPDAARALKLAAARRPQVVLMDINLPDASGVELTGKIKAMLPDTQVIIVTHLRDGGHVERALAAGATAYLTTEKILTDLLPLVAIALASGRGQTKESR